MSQGEATHGHRGDRNKPITRRRFLTALGTLAGSAVLAACATPTPQVIEKIVKETVVVKETVAVEKSVEKVVTATPVPKKPQTLMLWGTPRFTGKRGYEPGGKDTDWWDWQVQLFQEKYPWYTLKYELGGSNRAAAIAAGDWPHVLYSGASLMWTYAPQKQIAPINDFTPKETIDNWIEPFKNETTYVDGKLYAFPIVVAVGGGLMLNLTMAEKNKVLDLAPVKDFEKNPGRHWSADQCLEFMKGNTVAADGTYGTAWMTDWAYQVDQFLYSHGARMYTPDQCKVAPTRPEGVKGLQWLVDTEHKHKVAVPGSSGRTQDTALKMFVEGKIAMIPSQSAYIGIFRRTDGSGIEKFKFAFVAPPTDAGQEPASYVNPHCWFAFNFKESEKLEAAMVLGNFLSREESVEVHCRARGYVPPLKSLEKMFGVDPDHFASVQLAYKGGLRGHRVGEVQTECLVPMYDKAFLQKM
ncbi:MAG: extracellular solute-binding protein, partial [Anaerolineae bacterium]|nr:extracellular solute-binding protein [Anaerolineae bacterium]